MCHQLEHETATDKIRENNTDVNDIAFEQLPLVRDAMADYFIDRSDQNINKIPMCNDKNVRAD